MGGYADLDDYMIEGLAVPAGASILHGIDKFGDGWEGGWCVRLRLCQ